MGAESMNYQMPDLSKIGGYNRIQVPPIVIEPEGKENLMKIVEKIIKKMIEISPWQRWPSKVPKKKFLSERKINQLANNLIKNKELCLKPACLVLTMKNGSISLNVTNWINRGNHGDPRPLTDIQRLEQLMKDTKTEIGDIVRKKEIDEAREEERISRKKEIEKKEQEREEATPEETREVIYQLTRENWIPPKDFNHKQNQPNSFSFSFLSPPLFSKREGLEKEAL